MMFFLSAILPYSALVVLLCGTLLRLACWLRTPVPFRLTLFPVPEGTFSKVVRVARDLLFFPSLYREDRRLWGAVFLFHLSLAMVLAGHLAGIYFLRGQFVPFGATPQTSALISRFFGAGTGVLISFTLLALGLRRWASHDLRLLTEPGDWCALVLLLAVALSGMCMYLPGLDVDLSLVRAYLAGVIHLRPGTIPLNPAFLAHFTLALVLFLYFPLSRLMHAAGYLVIRSMLLESPPVFPTEPGKRARSRFSGEQDAPVPGGEGGGR